MHDKCIKMNKSVSDINECIESPGVCQGAASCINNIGSFECRCPDGYKLMPNERECLGNKNSFFFFNLCTYF